MRLEHNADFPEFQFFQVSSIREVFSLEIDVNFIISRLRIKTVIVMVMMMKRLLHQGFYCQAQLQLILRGK